jgi:AbrB family looped-hinge helix DNA binding protein
VDLARITARGQTTIPKAVRDAAGLSAGDVIAFEIEGDRLIVRKVVHGPDAELQALSDIMTEWSTPEDDAAWRDL